MKLLSFRSVKLRRLRVSRHLLPVGRRELDQDLLDESDRQEAERAEIRMIHMMIVKWKGQSAAANQYQDRRNELIETATSPWLLRLVPPPVRLFAEQEHRLLGELSSRLSYLAQRPVPSPNELHQRMRLIPLSQVAQYVGRGCRAAFVCGGRERALSGRERSASGQSRASQKAVELPPACGQAAQGTLKTGNPAPFQISPATSIC